MPVEHGFERPSAFEGENTLAGHVAPKPPARRASKEVLPEGWAAFVDEASGSLAYWCEATGETSWEKPADADAVEGTSEAAGASEEKTEDAGVLEAKGDERWTL